MENKVLIVSPSFNRPGGVASLFSILELGKNKSIKYFLMSGFSNEAFLKKIISVIGMYLSFTLECFGNDVIHLNPSLNAKSYWRDLIFVLISKLLNKKVLIYWHGWDKGFEAKIKTNFFLETLFMMSYKKADIHVVLGKCFKDSLLIFGVKESKIKIESNAASDEYIKSNLIIKTITEKSNIALLFISRLEKEKGIFQSIKTLEILRQSYNVHLIDA